MTGTLLQPGWFVALALWSFLVLAAAQLTIRLIMAFSVRTTLLGTLGVTLGALVVAMLYDAIIPSGAGVSTRLAYIPLTMALMALVGFATARWLLKIKRLRGQVIAALMVGLLDFHLFTVLST